MIVYVVLVVKDGEVDVHSDFFDSLGFLTHQFKTVNVLFNDAFNPIYFWSCGRGPFR